MNFKRIYMASKKSYKWAFLFMFVWVGMSKAGSDNQTGTAGALELLLPPDAVGGALAGQCVAYIKGVEAIHWNPAGIARSNNRMDAVMTQLNYLADIRLNYVAIQGAWNEIGSFAFSLKRFDFGEIPVTTEYAPDGTGETFSPGFNVACWTFGKSLLDRLQVGATVKYLSESISNVKASGVALDAGIQYAIHPALRVGVAVRNWGPKMRYEGSGLERKVSLPGSADESVSAKEYLRMVAAEFELPTVMDVGLSWHMIDGENHDFTINGTFQNQHLGMDQYGVSLVWEKQWSRASVLIRSGLQGALSEDGNFYFHDEHNLFGPSFGLGFEYPFVSGSAFAFDYAYAWTEYFDNIEWFSVSFHFPSIRTHKN